jgi:hypothetical protein
MSYEVRVRAGEVEVHIVAAAYAWVEQTAKEISEALSGAEQSASAKLIATALSKVGTSKEATK